MRVRLVWLGLCLFICGAPFAAAQVAASISGKVEDASGAAIGGVTVTVKNAETGSTRTATTDDQGEYRVPALPVGPQEVKAEKSGFRAAVRTGINLVVGQEAVVNLRLEVGEFAQEVTVAADAPLVNTTTAQVSGLVNEQQVKDLPLNGRSFDNLITLNPGTINYSALKSPQTSTSNGNTFSVAGRRTSENIVLWNGIEYTGSSQLAITPGGVSGELLGVDAIREFNVQTDTYSAEYGKRAGGQVTVVTQSGSNVLHGTMFEFLRNSALDARNFFDQASVPPFRRNQFGGALGGPLRKDKLFLFGNYEGFRQALAVTNVAVVPDAKARQGVIGGSLVPNLNPNILPYMSFWPTPNGPELGSGTAESFNNPRQNIREDFGTIRSDYVVSNRDSLSGAYTIDDGNSLIPLADPLFGSGVVIRNQIASLQ
ncbi:MAG TPA: carboxypeptidase-like regulatory domain-containing protein, partial [Bryobacteraceae bacterium]